MLDQKDQLDLFNAYLSFKSSERHSPAYNKAVKTMKRLSDKLQNGN
jgi:hypothetical protein